jgi:hypothetical protein
MNEQTHDVSHIDQMLQDRVTLINEGPIQDVINLAREIGYSQESPGAYMRSLITLFDARFVSEGIDKETI